MIELYTSHWRSSLLRDADATIIGISRGTPRGNPGYRYRVLRSLAPNDRTWALEDMEQFEQSYIAQLDALGKERVVGDLERISGGRPVVALCWERLADPGEYCHRQTLSRFIEQETGQHVPELQPGDLPLREDVSEQRLF